MFIYELEVRYKETDGQGIVHHSNYVTWLECARNAQLKSLGIRYEELEKRGFNFVIRDLNIKYRIPVKFGDDVTIKMYLTSLSGATIENYYEIYANDQLCVTASTKFATVKKVNDQFSIMRMDRDFPELYDKLKATM